MKIEEPTEKIDEGNRVNGSERVTQMEIINNLW